MVEFFFKVDNFLVGLRALSGVCVLWLGMWDSSYKEQVNLVVAQALS